MTTTSGKVTYEEPYLIIDGERVNRMDIEEVVAYNEDGELLEDPEEAYNAAMYQIWVSNGDTDSYSSGVYNIYHQDLDADAEQLILDAIRSM
jgi:hypothetical protein